MLWKPYHLQSPETEKSNMAARRPFWKWCCWKSIGSYGSIHISIVLLKFGVDIQSQTKFRVRKPKNPIWPPGDHFKLISLKINRLLPMTTINMHVKFWIEIPKQTWLMFRKPCRLHTDRRTSFSMNKPTTWCKSGWVSLVSSSCLYKTQPERALAQVCHTRIDALSPDEYQFHLLLHRNSHHSQATYPKWLNH